MEFNRVLKVMASTNGRPYGYGFRIPNCSVITAFEEMIILTVLEEEKDSIDFDMVNHGVVIHTPLPEEEGCYFIAIPTTDTVLTQEMLETAIDEYYPILTH